MSSANTADIIPVTKLTVLLNTGQTASVVRVEHITCQASMCLKRLRFYVQCDKKQVVSDTFYPANILAQY